jgi:hypothetical protein
VRKKVGTICVLLSCVILHAMESGYTQEESDLCTESNENQVIWRQIQDLQLDIENLLHDLQCTQHSRPQPTHFDLFSSVLHRARGHQHKAHQHTNDLLSALLAEQVTANHALIALVMKLYGSDQLAGECAKIEGQFEQAQVNRSSGWLLKIISELHARMGSHIPRSTSTEWLSGHIDSSESE